MSSLLSVLLIEDNPGDAELVQKSLVTSRVELHVACDGEEALEYLQQTTRDPELRRPDLILLDLNLPGINGREVLVELKSSRRFRSIPVVILSSSDAPSDIRDSYDLQASCFLTKPLDLAAFAETVRSFEHYWTQVVKLPLN